MKYTAQEVIQYVQEEDVKFIRLAFCYVSGGNNNLPIMPGLLRRAFEHGRAFDASASRALAAPCGRTFFCARTRPRWQGSPGGRKTAPWCGCSAM